MKQIAFDLDLAWKIQRGEKKGRIVTRNGNKARLICDDLLRDGDYHVVYATLNGGGDTENVQIVDVDGLRDLRGESNLDLLLEVEDEYTFNIFDKVVARSSSIATWTIDFFEKINIPSDRDYKYSCACGDYDFCLPYTPDTAKLIGTTDEWTGNADGTYGKEVAE